MWAVVVALCALCLRSTASAQAAEFLLVGDSDHSTFLGCLNCSRFDSGSVCNRFGDAGSRFSSTSIWNPFGNYGSRFSPTSPWNKFASDPPVIVDRQGNFYGYFTASRLHSQRTTIQFFLAFLDNVDQVTEDLQRARDAFCDE